MVNILYMAYRRPGATLQPCTKLSILNRIFIFVAPNSVTFTLSQFLTEWSPLILPRSMHTNIQGRIKGEDKYIPKTTYVIIFIICKRKLYFYMTKNAMFILIQRKLFRAFCIISKTNYLFTIFRQLINLITLLQHFIFTWGFIAFLFLFFSSTILNFLSADHIFIFAWNTPALSFQYCLPDRQKWHRAWNYYWRTWKRGIWCFTMWSNRQRWQLHLCHPPEPSAIRQPAASTACLFACHLKTPIWHG